MPSGTTATCACYGEPQKTSDGPAGLPPGHRCVRWLRVRPWRARLVAGPTITPVFYVSDMAAAREFWTRAGLQVDEYGPGTRSSGTAPPSTIWTWRDRAGAQRGRYFTSVSIPGVATTLEGPRATDPATVVQPWGMEVQRQGPERQPDPGWAQRLRRGPK
ncbi:hypothetical protein HBB16_14305 [Pseudonocardia sp. MCCB 268]|nr:hypothetical protein [Pseudonocardia cytotoxica]